MPATYRSSSCYLRAELVDVLLDVRNWTPGAGAEVDDFPLFASCFFAPGAFTDAGAFERAEDVMYHLRGEFGRRLGLQQRDALRPVFGQGVLGTLLD